MIVNVMPQHRLPPTEGDSSTALLPGETREIVVPHAAVVQPLTAVRNVLIQASLAELKANGYYDRYAALIDGSVLEQLQALAMAPSWIPIDLALLHYDACERLQLSDAQFAALGKRVGDRVQDVTLIASTKKAAQKGQDLWQDIGALHRMWPRLFQGGSVQIVKVAPKALLAEERGFTLNRFHYYRMGHIAAMRSTHSAMGAQISNVRVVSYTPAREEMIVRVEWL